MGLGLWGSTAQGGHDDGNKQKEGKIPFQKNFKIWRYIFNPDWEIAGKSGRMHAENS